MTTHLLLKGESLEALKAQVVAEHGPAARIIKADSVVQGGIGGFLAKRYFEVTVEVPTPEVFRVAGESAQPASGAPTPHAVHGMVLPSRSGIAALLADADEAEDRLAEPMTLSTSSARFDQLFDELSARVTPGDASEPPAQQLSVTALPSPALRPDAGSSPMPAQFPLPAVPFSPIPAPDQAQTPPLPSRTAGDLVLLVGLRTDALRVAHSLSGRFGLSAVCVGGTITLKSALTVSDLRSAAHARADGVQNGCSVFVAYGAEPGTDVAAAVQRIGADQIWVVVDAGRKHEDTRLWVQNLATTVHIHAVAAFGLATTLTPESVQDLGVPVGWADGLLLGG